MDNKSLAYRAAETAIPFSVIPILFDILKHFTEGHSFLTVSCSIIKFSAIVTVLYILMKKFTLGEKEYVSYGRSFRYGFTICLFSSIICTLWAVLGIYVIFPGTMDVLMETLSKSFETMKIPFDYDEVIRIVPPALVFSSFFTCIFWGVLIPSILANFTKHQTPFSGSGDTGETNTTD